MSGSTATVERRHDRHRRALLAGLSRIRALLEHYVGDAAEWPAAEDDDHPDGSSEATGAALGRVCAVLGLSAFERDVLVLCASVELDSSFASLCAAAQGDPQRTAPTFSLALAAFPGAHWSALTPSAPLRRWGLIEVGPGSSLTASPLRIDEWVLHHLVGVRYVDERLGAVVDGISTSSHHLAASQQQLSERVANVWARAPRSDRPLILLLGIDSGSKRSVAAAACQRVGLELKHVAAGALLQLGASEQDTFIRIWRRQAKLTSGALLVDCDDLDGANSHAAPAVRRLLDRLAGDGVIVTGYERLPEASGGVRFEVAKPSPDEQGLLWRQSLGGDSVEDDAAVDALTSQFSLSGPVIRAAAAEALAAVAPCEPVKLGGALWDACRSYSRPHMESLAQRIQPSATWDDLILPEPARRVLREVAVHVRHRGTVYGRWGFASRYSRGLGISLLAAGPSGTGKTMAAEVLADDLRLNLYQIDLSQVVSKYIGETERNLGRLFDAADGGGAILLFDEADALFGKRSEVKDSHDRYANIEISYLLQRMEAYRGLAILTTNMKDALDPAFLRRIRFVVQFRFPDADERAQIWRRVFPAATPTQGLDFAKLARLNLVGGSIRNVAMSAAFLAAEDGSPVCMPHLARAARAELAKQDKPLNEGEVSSWT